MDLLLENRYRVMAYGLLRCQNAFHTGSDTSDRQIEQQVLLFQFVNSLTELVLMLYFRRLQGERSIILFLS